MEKKNNKKKTIIIVAIILGILLVGGLVLFLLLGNKKEEPKPVDPPKEEKITITFDADGGETIGSVEITKGETIELPTPTKEGYKFTGWYDGEKEVTNETKFEKDTTLKAKWEENKDDSEPEKKYYTVTFDSKGGSSVTSIKVECGKELKLPTTKPTKTGYKFVSWADKNGKVILDGALLSCENVTLYANWEKVEEAKKYYTVTFDSKGGSKVASIKVDCDKTLTLPANPTREGYTFVSWYDEHGKTILTGAKLSCEDITLYADWKANEKPKEYKCPSGYTLNGTKCNIEGTVKETCPEGTKTDGTLCIKTSDSNGGTRQCKEDTVSIDGKGHTWTGRGDYHFYGNSYGKCAYYKWESYDTQSKCTAANDIYHRTTWVSDLNGCYAEDKMNNYEIVCASDYQYYTSDQLSSKFGIHDNAKCLKKVDKVKYCDDGYTLTSGKCVKTIDATLE